MNSAIALCQLIALRPSDVNGCFLSTMASRVRRRGVAAVAEVDFTASFSFICLKQAMIDGVLADASAGQRLDVVQVLYSFLTLEMLASQIVQLALDVSPE